MFLRKAPLAGVWCSLSLGLMLFAGSGCRQRDAAPAAEQQPSGAGAAGAAAAAVPTFPDAEQVVIVDGAHDTLSAARLGLEAALHLSTDLPLPYPRVERHGDRFRVVLGRGTYASLRPLVRALFAASHPVQVLAAGQAGGDDVIKLGIVCTEGESVPLYATPLTTPPKELARLKHGQVVVLKEDEEEPRHGDHDGDEQQLSEVAERGYLTALQPQLGLVRGPDVLLPADCTPRDEDNDDGNGRILGAGASGSGELGRLCLTTRFAGRVGHLAHADVLAVTPNYRRCLHFPGAGTFDGFDHSRTGSLFAVEVDEGAHPAVGSNPTAGAPAFVGLRLYAVPAQGPLQPRGQWPGLSRPAFLGDHLIAVSEEAALAALFLVDGIAKRTAADTSPLPAPRRIAALALADVPRLPERVPVHRPAAPTLAGGRVRASFLRSCRPDGVKRVRAAAGASYVSCVLEIEAEVGLDGSRLERRCRLDNAETPLEEPLPTPCP